VKRGGSWNNIANNCRTANRNNNTPTNSNNNLGLRLANMFYAETAYPRTCGPSEKHPAACPRRKK